MTITQYVIYNVHMIQAIIIFEVISFTDGLMQSPYPGQFFWISRQVPQPTSSIIFFVVLLQYISLAFSSYVHPSLGLHSYLKGKKSVGFLTDSIHLPYAEDTGLQVLKSIYNPRTKSIFVVVEIHKYLEVRDEVSKKNIELQSTLKKRNNKL